MKFENVGEIEQIFPSIWKWTVKNCDQYVVADKLYIRSRKFTYKQSNVITNWRLGFTASNPLYFSVVIIDNYDQTDVIAGIKWSGSSIGDPSSFKPANKLIFSKSESKRYWMNVKGCDYENTLVLYCCILLDLEPVLQTTDEVDCLMLDDFEKQLDNEKLSDVTLLLPRNKKIYAHKVILSSRSPVFEAMFEHEMKENQLNTVKITDVKYRIMKELLRFIYTGRVKRIENISRDLLVAADKYYVDKLKILCENSIFERVNSDNASEIMQLAITYNCTVLKTEVYEYIVTHIKDICKKPNFTELDTKIKDELIAILADKI